MLMVSAQLDIRAPRATKWEARDFERPIMRKKNSFFWAIIGLLALIIIAFASKPTPVQSTPASVATSTVEVKQDKLDVYLSRLAWTYECVGKCAVAERTHSNFRIIDSNNQYSYGCLQFQQDTYLAMAKRYKVDPWAGRGIYDCENQWKIARAMFEENPTSAANHWYTSIYVRGLGLPTL